MDGNSEPKPTIIIYNPVGKGQAGAMLEQALKQNAEIVYGCFVMTDPVGHTAVVWIDDLQNDSVERLRHLTRHSHAVIVFGGISSQQYFGKHPDVEEIVVECPDIYTVVDLLELGPAEAAKQILAA